MSTQESRTTGVDPAETAYWVAAMERMEQAADLSRFVRHGWAVNPPTTQTITEGMPGEEDFEHAIVHAQQSLTRKIRLNTLITAIQNGTLREDAQQRPVVEALSRIKAFEHQGTDMKLGVVAAFYFMRGDIRESADRAVYEHHGFIDGRVALLEAVAPQRVVQQQAVNRTNPIERPVYAVAELGFSDLPYNPAVLGEKQETYYWWDELKADLQKMGDVSDELRAQA